jgi:peroxiredoxin
MWRNIIAAVILSGLIIWGIVDYVVDDKSRNATNDNKDTQEIDQSTNPDEKNKEPNTSDDKNKKEKTGIKVGNIAPDFTLENLSGETVSLSDYRGKKVIINMWATWCPPCRVEMPDMQRFYENHAGDDVEILAVNMTSQDSISSIEEFKEKIGITFPILLDTHNEVGVTYRVLQIPTTWFIDRNGVITNIVLGAMNEEVMIKSINQMDN